jgi:hypothetical protein
MGNMDDMDLLVKIVEEMKNHEKKQNEFELDKYVINFLHLHTDTVKEMISLLKDTRSLDILKERTGVSDNTITKLKDNLESIRGKMK